MALIYEPRIFREYPNVRAGITLRSPKRDPFGFNFSLAIDDDPKRVGDHRRWLLDRLGFARDKLATQSQIHGDAIVWVKEGYEAVSSDAMFTDEPGWLLAVSVADCVPILMYDPERDIVAAVHSGWRGSLLDIAGKTVARLEREFNTRPDELLVWIGPSAGQCCYEVGKDVAGEFDGRHSRAVGGGKYLFDNKGLVLDQLIAADVLSSRIELDVRCTICDARFHSYRRDRERSGRMFAAIGMKA